LGRHPNVARMALTDASAPLGAGRASDLSAWDFQRGADLNNSATRDRSLISPTYDGRPSHAENGCKPHRSSCLVDQCLDVGRGLSCHGANCLLFRRSLSSWFVDTSDTRLMGVRQSVEMTNLKAIGRRVAELRRQAGQTQDELADIIGLARGTMGSIETGGNRGGIVTMVAIADYFKVPMDWLLCREVPPGGPLTGEFIDRPDELAWIAFWRGLTQGERAAALKMLRVPEIDRVGA
jgi:transcriptional regulator with XRE-family HTH domain